MRRLQWFTHGFYAVGRKGDAVVMTDLHVVPVKSRRLLAERRLDRLGEIWNRLRGAPVAAGPAKVPVEPLRGG